MSPKPKREFDEAFTASQAPGEPDELRETCKSSFQPAEEIVDSAMPKQILREQTKNPDSSKYMPITILCAAHLAERQAQDRVEALCHRFWAGACDRQERNVLGRFLRLSQNTDPVDIVYEWIAEPAATMRAEVKRPNTTIARAERSPETITTITESSNEDDHAGGSSETVTAISKFSNEDDPIVLYDTDESIPEPRTQTPPRQHDEPSQHDPIDSDTDDIGTDYDISAGSFLTLAQRRADMPDFPNDNIFAKSPRTDKLICPMIVVKGGKAVMCATEFVEAHSGNFFKHIRGLHKVTHNSRGTEFFALFKQTSALILGMALKQEEMAKLNDVYYEQGIGAVMDTLKERRRMPDCVGSPTSHTKLQQTDLVRVAVRIFKDKQWGKKTLLPAIHGILAQFEPKLENVRPDALAQHSKNAYDMDTACWPSEVLASPDRQSEQDYGVKKTKHALRKSFSHRPAGRTASISECRLHSQLYDKQRVKSSRAHASVKEFYLCCLCRCLENCPGFGAPLCENIGIRGAVEWKSDDFDFFPSPGIGCAPSRRM
ncbi:hypothetical protein CB0940_03534 [Cercospora beticola]|uniref:Uncharacterized protein n=1 Tax=Cercospora beticola TaxID=122368 RepID=A0A2G5I3I0_CERBT|nr:hypothetical protein CB0940_03534 [Cercospora beticola]PIA99318.1 hypothetical protein CB0940_03534 [Cercospora beticola]WPB00708.1 hypothetical protein RHO25_005328 [Cercospora beticola]